MRIDPVAGEVRYGVLTDLVVVQQDLRALGDYALNRGEISDRGRVALLPHLSRLARTLGIDIGVNDNLEDPT